MNSSAVIVFLGLLAFCGVAATTVAWKVPTIEATLATEAAQKLVAKDLVFAKIEADGRDLILSGEAPSDRSRQEARRVVATTWGHRVIYDRMTVASATRAVARPPETATSTPAAALAAVACQRELKELLTLNQFQFEFGNARLRADNDPILDLVLQAFRQCPEANFEIEGHTDNTGPEAYNIRLSQLRAEAVLKALAERGIETSRMRAVGYGPQHPLVPNDTLEGRTRNRRIDVTVRTDRKD